MGHKANSDAHKAEGDQKQSEGHESNERRQNVTELDCRDAKSTNKNQTAPLKRDKMDQNLNTNTQRDVKQPKGHLSYTEKWIQVRR